MHDATNVYNYFKKITAESNIFIFGRSIGTGVATHIASLNKPKSLILMSAYTNIKAVAKGLASIFGNFVSDRFRNIDIID